MSNDKTKVAEFTNEADGVRAEVWAIGARFHVCLFDIDAAEYVGHIAIFNERAAAMANASSLIPA